MSYGASFMFFLDAAFLRLMQEISMFFQSHTNYETGLLSATQFQRMGFPALTSLVLPN